MTEAVKPHPSVEALPEQFRGVLNALRLEAPGRRSIQYISAEVNNAGGEDWLNVTMHIDPAKRAEHMESVYLIEFMEIAHHLLTTNIVLGREYLKGEVPHEFDANSKPAIIYRQSADWPAVQPTLFRADFEWPHN